MPTSFSEVTGLVINYTKSLFTPIWCANIYLNDVLQSFLASRILFPMWDLGLLPSVTHHMRIHSNIWRIRSP